MRAGANEFLLQPLKRTEFRDAMGRLERAPRHGTAGESKLGKIYTFIGTKGGVGTTTLAVNFATVLAQRKLSTVADRPGLDRQRRRHATRRFAAVHADGSGRESGALDQALFEGFVTRDPLGFFLVGPPDALEQHGHFSDHLLREFATFLVEKYDAIVIDGGRNISNELVLAAAQVSASVFLVIDQEFPSIRNAQRYISFLMRMGFNQDQIKVVVNRYTKKINRNQASLEQIQQTLNQTGVLRNSAFAGGARVHQQGPAVRGQPRSRRATWTASSAPSWIRPPAARRARPPRPWRMTAIMKAHHG